MVLGLAVWGEKLNQYTLKLRKPSTTEVHVLSLMRRKWLIAAMGSSRKCEGLVGMSRVGLGFSRFKS